VKGAPSACIIGIEFTDASILFASRLSSTHPAGMKCLGLSPALPGGRTECVPPRKSPFASHPGFPRKAIPAPVTNPAEGRAPHARKEGTGLTVAYPRWAAAPSPTHRVGMKCLGIRTALPRGRTECVPPRKPPPRNLRVSPVRPCVLGSPPVEGRAPHARKDGITLTPTLPLLGHRLLGKAPVATQCLAIRPAVPCGRGDRAPPRKPPFASSGGFPR